MSNRSANQRIFVMYCDFIIYHSIELIAAPRHDQRLIGLVEGLFQPLKRRFVCITEATKTQFNLEASVSS